jgi:hypothetical protein
MASRLGQNALAKMQESDEFDLLMDFGRRIAS